MAAALAGLVLTATVPAGGAAQECAGIKATVARADACLVPKGTFKDCPACPTMVVVPAGRFAMGSDEASDETPIHDVVLARPFAAGKFEVTFEEWDACVADGGCALAPKDYGWGRGKKPVVGISWNDVTRSYLPWLSRKSGVAYRLLTESEWEYAARAGTRTHYAWGDEPGTGRANCDRCGSAWDNKQPAPVGSFPPNAFGLHDMHGNVWEWTQDCYADSYAGAPANGSARTKSPCRSHVVRGGGWSDRPMYLRSAIRYGDPPVYRSNYVGFRVARDLGQ